MDDTKDVIFWTWALAAVQSVFFVLGSGVVYILNLNSKRMDVQDNRMEAANIRIDGAEAAVHVNALAVEGAKLGTANLKIDMTEKIAQQLEKVYGTISSGNQKIDTKIDALGIMLGEKIDDWNTKSIERNDQLRRDLQSDVRSALGNRVVDKGHP